MKALLTILLGFLSMASFSQQYTQTVPRPDTTGIIVTTCSFTIGTNGNLSGVYIFGTSHPLYKSGYTAFYYNDSLTYVPTLLLDLYTQMGLPYYTVKDKGITLFGGEETPIKIYSGGTGSRKNVPIDSAGVLSAPVTIKNLK